MPAGRSSSPPTAVSSEKLYCPLHPYKPPLHAPAFAAQRLPSDFPPFRWPALPLHRQLNGSRHRRDYGPPVEQGPLWDLPQSAHRAARLTSTTTAETGRNPRIGNARRPEALPPGSSRSAGLGSGRRTMQHRLYWLDYDPVALAVLLIGMGMVGLLALFM